MRSDYEGTEPDFMVEPFVLEDDRSVGTENVTVWILESNCWGVVVVDLKGNVTECGHGRPVRVDERWRPDL